MIVRTQANKQTTAYSDRKAEITTWRAPDTKLIVVKTKKVKTGKLNKDNFI